jgi:integrase
VHRCVVRGKLKVLLNVGMTKNGAPRLMPVPPKARWALATCRSRARPRYYYERMRDGARRAGLPDIVPHDGRHIVATDIILNEGTLADVSVALHHKSLLSSARYVHLLTQHAERVLGDRRQKNAHRPVCQVTYKGR